MFQKGQEVECIDDKEVNAALKKSDRYYVLEFISSLNCIGELATHPAKWQENGGRVELSKYPGCYWYSRRFKAQ